MKEVHNKVDALLKIIKANQLELIAKARAEFPRFYFVPEKAMLEILFEEPKTVMKNGLYF